MTAQLSELDRPATSFVATGERILELEQLAGILYETQDPTKQRRVLESVLSNCIFDRGSLCPDVEKGHSTCSSEGTEQENGGEGGIRPPSRLPPSALARYREHGAAAADLIVSGDAIRPKLAPNSNASEGGWRAVWDEFRNWAQRG